MAEAHVQAKTFAPPKPVGRGRILVVEDEEHLAQGIKENLAAEGHEADVVGDGQQALQRLAQETVDVVVLDVMLPGRDGFSVCEALRARGDTTPILFLTARNTHDERVRGLKAGGDDYLGKPFHLAELLLRVASMVRRRHWSPKSACMPPPNAQISASTSIDLGHCRVDFSHLCIAHKDGQQSFLTHREAAILRALVRERGQTVSREDLLIAGWGHEAFPSSRVLDALVARLNTCLHRGDAGEKAIATVAGLGHQLRS